MGFQRLRSCLGSTGRHWRCGLIVVLGALLTPHVWAQNRPNKPALIRDTDTAEGKNEAPPPEKTYDPMQAEKSVKIGNFYFKRKNYHAAIQRYLEALEYQPSLIVAYDNLGRAYEKNNDHEKALQVYRDYIQKNPSSEIVAEFTSRIVKLEKKLPKSQ